MRTISSYLLLTKPRISLLFAFTGLTALLMEGTLRKDQWRLWLITLAIYLIGGSANAFNQYFERSIDAAMTRTAKKRPLPLGHLSPTQALIFSLAIGAAGIALLKEYGHWLAATLGLATILFYSFFYTLWLKPRTPYNIVIGGAAGAAGPLIGWAAAAGRVDLVPFLLFLTIFFWTPPHFWSLALTCKEDYARVGLPMLPNVAGDCATRRQILYYSLTLLPLSLSITFIGPRGWFYTAVASLLSLLFLAGAFRLHREKSSKAALQLFGFSIIYLLLLFSAMIVEILLLEH